MPAFNFILFSLALDKIKLSLHEDNDAPRKAAAYPASSGWRQRCEKQHAPYHVRHARAVGQCRYQIRNDLNKQVKNTTDMKKATNIVAQFNWKAQVKDIFFLFIGVLMYAVGYTAFILPEKVVQGAVAGISALIFYATNFPPSISIWVLNAIMIIIAIKALTRQFVIRTVMGVTMISLCVGILQPFFAAHPIITPGEDKFMHVLIGALLSGTGLGLAFTHNGSTGGTDILIAVLNKYFNVSFGRAMQFIDFTIISSSYLLFHSVETIIYGIVFTLVVSFMLDYVVNGSRQTVQLIIISKEYQKIANNVMNQMHRGVTLLDGKGWYSKKDVNILIILAHKYELQDVMYLVKQTDPRAMVSQTFCHGVFGEGFDEIKVTGKNFSKQKKELEEHS